MAPDEGGLGAAYSPAGPDEMFREALTLIAEGMTELVGFGLACISVVRPRVDGEDELEAITVAGHEHANEAVVGRRTLLSSLLTELKKAEDWGHFKFLPHELLGEEDVENAYGWVVPDLEVLDEPDAWHPLDLLVALLYDDNGTLRGTLAIDVPDDGRRPGPEQRRLLEKFAAQAGRAVVTTLEREELAEQVRLADTARTVVRNASSQRALPQVLAECQTGLVEGFRARGSWIHTFDEDGAGSGSVHSWSGAQIELPTELVALAERAGRRCWAEQTTAVVAADRRHPDVISERDQELIVELLDDIGVSSLLFVPLGAGSECLGNLVLTRGVDAPDWSEVERTAALDIGHDLGRVVLNARTLDWEHQLVVELKALDTYKSQLIATVSHELKNPIAAISGYLEMLEPGPELDPHSRRALDGMARGTARLSRVVNDLLLLSKVGDPGHRLVPLPVDLKGVVREVVDLVSVQARRKDVSLSCELPDEDVVAHGDAWELDRAVTNLVSNAVKYSPTGSSVGIRLWRDGPQVHVAVQDEGLGISLGDQERLFDEFYRSSNPEAAREPGSGLGLTIVKRIVDRHGGQITVDSAVGRGSVFTVTLPAAPSS